MNSFEIEGVNISRVAKTSLVGPFRCAGKRKEGYGASRSLERSTGKKSLKIYSRVDLKSLGTGVGGYTYKVHRTRHH
jgi:hypothetical protein